MAVKVAINGFGRIGRLVLRAIYETGRDDIEVVAINDLADVKTNAMLLKYDSVHGRFPGTIEARDDAIVINGHAVKAFANPDPAGLPWGDLGIDIAMECSGRFTERDKAARHLDAGAGKVLISAPGKNEDITVVYGVNDDALTAEHKIVSNASCTTNCLAPAAYVIDKLVGIERGFMTTIHSYTGDQRIVDTMHKDLHRARAAALNIIPTTTGAARAVGKVLPHLNGKLDGVAIRVPTPNVSLVDFKFNAARTTSAEEIGEAIKAAAADGPLKGVLGWYDEPLVSMDFNHDSRSSIFAIEETKVLDGTFCRIMTWYDNEWGFSCRMADTAVKMARIG